MKKKIIVALCLICAIVCGVTVVGITSKASGATISIGVDNQTVKKEDGFTVRVTVSSDTAMQNIDTMFNYDPEVLEFVSSDSYAVVGASGMIHIMEEFLDPVNEITYTMNFKALEVGNSNLSVSETFISEAETFNVVPVSSDSVVMEVITNKQESQETRLSELLIAPGTLNEEFNPDVYEYTAEAAYEDETVAISAIPMDGDAVVTMEKSDTLSFGANTVVITVTAPSGNVGTYTLTINRSTEPTQETQESESETMEETTEETVEETAQTETAQSELVEETEDVIPEETVSETDMQESVPMETQPAESEAVSESQPQEESAALESETLESSVNESEGESTQAEPVDAQGMVIVDGQD